MADEQEESHDKADSDGDEPTADEERTLEEIGDELVVLLEEIRLEQAAINERLARIEAANAAGHEHPHEHQHEHEQYARGDHSHAESSEPGPGSGEEAGEKERRESAPRSNHPYYREWPPWKH